MLSKLVEATGFVALLCYLRMVWILFSTFKILHRDSVLWLYRLINCSQTLASKNQPMLVLLDFKFCVYLIVDVTLKKLI